MPPQNLCSTHGSQPSLRHPAGYATAPDSGDIQVKFLNVLREIWCFFGSGFLTSRPFTFSSKQKLSHFFSKLAHLMWQVSPDTSLRKNQPDVLIKTWQSLQKVGRSSLPEGLWPENHQFTEAQRSEGTSKVTQQIREWAHFQSGIFGSKRMFFSFALFSVLKNLTTSGETCT